MKQSSLQVRTGLQAGGLAKYLCEDDDTTCGAHDIATGQPRDDVFRCQTTRYAGPLGGVGSTGNVMQKCKTAVAAAGLTGKVDCYKC